MTNNFSPSIEKIVNDYLKRLKLHLKGFPEKDKEELVKEVYSHIYESFVSDPTEDEIDRILNVLNKLGEPTEVVSSRMSTAMVSMGKKRKLPLYILAGVTIALFGVPLGIGGFAFLLGILITVGALIFAYYITAFSLVVAGWLGLIAAIIKIVDPGILDRYGIETMTFFADPTLSGVIGIVASIICAALGFFMFWLGKYMMQGIRFLFSLPMEKVKEARERRRLKMVQSKYD
ncbi:MAG: DUF1700 domain-containing protein [bacterium]